MNTSVKQEMYNEASIYMVTNNLLLIGNRDKKLV